VKVVAALRPAFVAVHVTVVVVIAKIDPDCGTQDAVIGPETPSSAIGDANVTTAPAGAVAFTVMFGGAAPKTGSEAIAVHADAPGTVVVVPAGHGVAAIAPTVPTELPIGASVHAIEPGLAANVPALQRVDETAPIELT
jgi:hypothetical protein